jgi:xylulokinase
VAVDRDGNHLMNAIGWMDTRGEPYIEKIIDGPLKVEDYSIRKIEKWLRITGGAPTKSGKDPLAHILYIKNELPGIYEKTYKFLEPKDFINMKLTGRFVSTYETITLHWVTDNRDINNIRYHDSLMKISGLDREKLPDLCGSTDVIGTLKSDVARKLGLKSDVKVIGGTPDVQSASIGSGAVKDYEGHLYIGTSSWLTCHVPFKKTDIVHSMASLPSGIPGRYLVTNEQETAGKCLTFLHDCIYSDEKGFLELKNPHKIYDTFNNLAEKAPPGSNNLMFLPWLYGERTPIEDSTVRGGFLNLSLQNSRNDIIRSVYEGVAFNTRWLFKYVQRFIKQDMESLNFIGGGANSDLWCQIFADVMDTEIKRVKDPILANLRGTAYLASAALNHINFDDISTLTAIERSFQPNPENRNTYDSLFKLFLKIYRKNRGIFKKLNRR